MKLLLELARIANLKRVSKIDIFDAHSIRSKNSKFNTFYEAMTAGKYRTDRDAAKALYNTTPADDRYRQLKSRFRRRLLNTIFFLNANGAIKPRYEQALADCYRDWALVNILKLYDGEQSVPYLCKQISTLSLRHHFTSLLVSSLQTLKEIAAKEGDQKEHSRLVELLETYEPLDLAEARATTMLQTIQLRLSDEANIPTELEWNYWREQLIQLSEQYPSPYTRYMSYLVGAMQFIEEGKYDVTILVCQEADQMMRAHSDQFSGENLFQIRYLMLQAYYQSEQYDQAVKSAEQAIKDIEIGSVNLLKYFDLYFLLALRTENYAATFAILQKAFQQDAFQKIDEWARKKWELYQAALYYMITIHPELAKFKSSRLMVEFKLDAFLGDAALFPKEYRILSIWTLILQLLFHIEKGNAAIVADLSDRLKQYTRKQLHLQRHQRIIEFIRCLSTLAKSDLKGTNLRLDNKYYLRLLSLPHRYTGHLDQWEILPFPTLWLLIHKRIQPLTS